MFRKCLLVALCLAPLACNQNGPVEGAAPKPEAVTMGDQTGDGPRPTAEAVPAQTDYLKTTHWPPAKLESGTASISCEYDYVANGDGARITSLEFFSLVDAMTDCQQKGVVRLRYKGSIGAGFTALVERVAAIATRMEIDTRILDIDSTGGHVEEAIHAGDAIGEEHWAIWVREGSICHSACVLILAAGDTRSISGKIGIHRLIRDQSIATTRAELNAELKGISEQVRYYLERNGVAEAVADLMMTVANRDLRILGNDELKQYGLDGTNAAQDDLDRISIRRKCGEAFVRRKDLFRRAFDSQCMDPGKAFEAMTECGLALQQQFGFPDRKCSADNPMAEYEKQFRHGALTMSSNEVPSGTKPKPAMPSGQ